VSPRAKKAAAEPSIVAWKGMDQNLKCRGFQFKVGESYEHAGRIAACSSGFHACLNPMDVWGYYPLAEGNRFCRVHLSGATDGNDGDSKIAAGKIFIETEVTLGEMIKAGVEYVFANIKATKTNTGDRSASTNTGDRSASTNTGDQSASTNTGDRSASTNTGDQSASTNTGDRSASTNTGDQSASTNTGYRSASTNTGDQSASTNTGDQSASTNTGDQSAASVEGKDSVALASGIGGVAKASLGSGFVVAEHDSDWNLIRLHAAMAGKDGIKPDTFYRAEGGKLVEVLS
jgi:hypothetical protein